MMAFILAAGEGRRMRPLTLNTPKPLLKVGEQSLIEHHILRLRDAGIREFVINVCYLGQQIIDRIGDGARYQVTIRYSQEPMLLETGGGIAKARDLLGESPFLLVNGDTWCDLDYKTLIDTRANNMVNIAMHMVMVNNPGHNERGDFYLGQDGVIEPHSDAGHNLTFSGISVIDPTWFFSYPNIREKFPLKEVFDWFIEKRQVSGELYTGNWIDVGTPERLDMLKAML